MKVVVTQTDVQRQAVRRAPVILQEERVFVYVRLGERARCSFARKRLSEAERPFGREIRVAVERV